MLMDLSRDASMIKKSAFRVFRWKNVAEGSYDAVISPVWIVLPWLSERYWFPEFQSAIGNSIGRFIRVDHPTASLVCPSVARICVEVDLSADLPSKVGIKYKGIFGKKCVSKYTGVLH